MIMHLKIKLISLAIVFSQPMWGEYEFERLLNNPPLVDKDIDYPLDPAWVLSCLTDRNKDADIAEFADLLVKMKASFVSQGYQIAPLSELCLNIRQRLIDNGTPAKEEDIQKLYNELLKRDE